MDRILIEGVVEHGRRLGRELVERSLETHIFDFRGELYGRWLRVELLEKIRDERRFASVEELRGQIARDKE